MIDYPAERAARLYAGYARDLGATEPAMRALAAITTITQEDIDMATAKKRDAAPAVKKATRGFGKNAAVKNESATHDAGLKTGTAKEDLPAHGKVPAKRAAAKETPAAKKATAKGAAKAPAAKKTTAKKTEGEARATASGMFKALIREGKLSDDDIFKAVQKQFGLDEKKRSYVAWYRNDLRKRGEKVPDGK